MKRFANLLRKEIKELATKQLVVSLVFTVVLFNFIGQVSKKEVQKAVGIQTISALDQDGTPASQALIKGLESARFKVLDQSGKAKEQALETARAGESKLLLVIPKGFGDSLRELKPSEIETYSFMRSFSLIGARGQVVVQGVIAALNEAVSNDFLKEKLPGLDPAGLKKPIRSRDFVVVRDRVAEGSANMVAGLISQQSMLIPIVLMMIVIYSSQMVISAVALEKQNKTLETLLTVPIKRTSIITAKMLAAGLVGLISAGVYMFGFQGFVGGIGEEAARAGAQDGGAALMQKLGLTFSTGGYAILGLSIFLAILVALAAAMILGVLAEDLRSAQSMMMPLMFMVMIPYFISLFADLNTMSLPLKVFVLAIPFTHPFLVSQNLYLGNYGLIAAGLGYMLLVFAVLVVYAAKIFSTDKILTMKLRFGKKKAAVA
ncbi:MAG TPA: ABC transporter permease [Candidatus Aminicenantes bacterium]|nr:ABC transporter permease [Candidatus Aminicenantes bacterium]HRY63851.1 ABC transporter permease [Candidatus Aminicenantes bacterium]HRZ70764.1 ABC transporter permease [Candidatus Aminicenantes bacterium]